MIDAGAGESVTAFLDVIGRWSGSKSDPAHAYDGAARNMIAIAFWRTRTDGSRTGHVTPAGDRSGLAAATPVWPAVAALVS
jgi:hypothetical protein